MKPLDVAAHHKLVNEFFDQCKENEPGRFAEVAEKYPTLGRGRFRAIRYREQSVGLLGLQPSRISTDVAMKYKYESAYDEEESE